MTFTEAVDKLTETTQSLSEQVSRLTANQEIADLDRRWEMQRNEFMITGKNGRTHLPTEGTAMVGGIVAVVFGGFWTVMAFAITSRSPFGMAKIFPLFGLVFIAVGIFSAIHASSKASEYKQAKRRYEAERTRLKRK
ncbi:putative membrane protein [Rhodopirellula maiorica SM1]|uniref:Putative membrane protein n=1 Tax=Rhodopirellula maiorica SM1 TaxID=1265738 RepID=M5R820_9BACT|nr:putative membrane protein [Rhodopirellula maiorica SM1]